MVHAGGFVDQQLKKIQIPANCNKKNMWFSNMWLLAMDGEFDAWALVVLWCRLTIAENSWVSEPQAETDEVVEWMAEPAGGRVNGVWLLVNTQICKQIGTSKCKWCFVWPACTGDILPVLAALLAVFGKALFVDRFWNFNLLLLVGLWSCCTLIQYNMQTWSWLIIYSNHFFGHSDFPKKYWGIAVNTVVFHETTENEFVVSALLKETCLWVKFEYLVVIPKCRLSPTTLLPRLRNPAFLQRLNVEKNTFLVWSVKPRKLTHNLLHQPFAGVFKQHLGYHKFVVPVWTHLTSNICDIVNWNIKTWTNPPVTRSSQSTYWTDQNYVWSPQFARWLLRTTRRCSLSGSLVLRSCHFSEMKRSIGTEWNCKVIFANAWLSEAAALVCTG